MLGIRFSDAGLTEAAGLGALGASSPRAAHHARAAVRPALGSGSPCRRSRWSSASLSSARRCTSRSTWTGGPRSCGARCCRRRTRPRLQRAPRGGRAGGCGGVAGAGSGINDVPVALAVVLLASGDPITWLTPLLASTSSAPARSSGTCWAGRGVGAAARRAAGDGPVPARRARRLPARLLCGRSRTRRACSRPDRRAGARQLQPAAPRRRAVVRRGDGVAGQIGLFVLLGLTPPDASPTPSSRAVAGAPWWWPPAALGRSRRRRRSGCRGASRRSCRGPGCAAPCRSCWRWSRCRRAHRMRSGWSTSCSCWWWCSPCCRGRRCRSWRAGWASSSRAPRDRGRLRPAGRAGRRPAAGPGAGGLPAARGLPARAAAAARRDGEPGRARQEAFTPPVDTRLRVGDQLSSSPRPRPASARSADPCGRPGRRLAAGTASRGTDPVGTMGR